MAAILTDAPGAEDRLVRAYGRGIGILPDRPAAGRAVVVSGLLGWLARHGRAARWGAALGLLALAALPALWFSSQNRRLERAAAALRQEITGGVQSAEALQREIAAAEERHLAARAELEERLARAEAQAATAAPSLSPLEIPVLLLATVRGENEPPSIDAGKPVALAVDVGAGPAYSSYTLTVRYAEGTVRDAAGKVLLRRAGLQPNALEVLMLTFPARFFAPGDYRLEVAGVEAGGASAALSGYAFRAGR